MASQRYSAYARLYRNGREVVYRASFGYFKNALRWCRRWIYDPDLKLAEIYDVASVKPYPVWTHIDGLLGSVGGRNTERGIGKLWWHGWPEKDALTPGKKVGIERISIEPETREPYIRELGVKFWDVYRELNLHGTSELELLRKFPGLEVDDITAVRYYAVYLIKSRTHDELTGRPILPKHRLTHGGYFKGRCRNATLARWHSEEDRFYYWREKFGRIYIETIRYPTDETEPWFDVFNVYKELHNPPFEIPFEHAASFNGNPKDLWVFNEEMWSRPPSNERAEH